MDVRFPERKTDAVIQAMTKRATPPWRRQGHDAFGRPADDGSFYFHRERVKNAPPCTLCMRLEAVGHLVVQAIVPDANTVHQLPIDQYVKILREFDTQIAGPVAEELNGITQIGTSKHTLEDYYSAEAIRLLELFCKTSSHADRGSNLSDQERWIAFLLHVHRNEKQVHCDTFGACLKAKEWWPRDGIRALVHEYDFAMLLLRQSEATV